LSSVDILIPEANLSSSHTTKTTSFRRYGIAEAYTARDFLLKTGLKSEFGSVEPKISVAKSNRAYAVSSDITRMCLFRVRGGDGEMFFLDLWMGLRV
jgi:hypothetical protein